MLSTASIPVRSNFSKTIEPGNKMAKINDITLQESRFEEGKAKGELDIILHLEGVDLGDTFEGFFIDKDDASKGRHAGQIGRVRATPFPFSDGVIASTGREVKRDMEILGFLKELAIEMGKTAELDAIKANTIEEYVPQAAAILKGDIFLNFCFAAREYMKGNYVNYDLYLPRFSKGKKPFQNAEAEVNKVIVFNSAEHIRTKKAATTVSAFDAPVNADFDVV